MFTVKLTPNDKGTPIGKLADAELHFTSTEHTCTACDGSGEVIVADCGPLAGGTGICRACDGKGNLASPLAGLKFVGFAIWERRSGTGRNVTFPARAYSVNGERRSFALLRPVTDAASQDIVRDLILDAYAAFERDVAEAR